MSTQRRLRRLEQITGETEKMTWKEFIDKMNAGEPMPEFDQWIQEREKELNHENRAENQSD